MAISFDDIINAIASGHILSDWRLYFGIGLGALVLGVFTGIGSGIGNTIGTYIANKTIIKRLSQMEETIKNLNDKIKKSFGNGNKIDNNLNKISGYDPNLDKSRLPSLP